MSLLDTETTMENIAAPPGLSLICNLNTLPEGITQQFITRLICGEWALRNDRTGDHTEVLKAARAFERYLSGAV